MDEKKKSGVSNQAKAEAAKKAAAAQKAAQAKKSGAARSAKADEKPERKTPPKKEAPVREAEDEAVEEREEEEPAKKRKAVNLSQAQRKQVKGLRVGAVILWVLALAAEVGAFFALSYAVRNNAFVNGFDLARPEILLLVGALAVDAVLCIVAAQLWKKSNKLSPCLASSKLVRTLWHQLGVIMVLICFIPIGIILLLKTKELDKKTRTILLAVMLALFAGTTAASVDYQQPTQTEVEQLQEEAVEANPDELVYWTRYGKSYHFDENCRALKRSNPDNIFTGSLQDAFDNNRWDPCDYCAAPEDDTAE